MAYRLDITIHADELLEERVNYLIYKFQSKQAASHLLSEIDNIYIRLEENPMQFPICSDPYLASKDYHEAFTTEMNYIVIFAINEDTVTIVGIFHQLEDYKNKV